MFEMDKCREEFEKHFLSLKFATEGVAQTVLDACTFDKDQNVYLPNMEWFLHNDDQEGVVYCSMLNTCYMSFQSRQTEVDELQTLYIQQGINMLKLQKRVDKALELMQKPVIVGEPTNYVCARFKELEQALKGEGQ